MGKTRILFVLGCVALLTACGAVPKPHDGGLRQQGRLDYTHVVTHREVQGMDAAGIDIGTRDKGPKTITIEKDGAQYRFVSMATVAELPASWFLMEIWEIASDPSNNVPPEYLPAIALGIEQRTKSMHHLHIGDESWARIRLSYLHALDQDWKECAQKLMEYPGGDVPAGWPEYTPTEELPSDVTIKHLLWGGDASKPEYKGLDKFLEESGHSDAEREKVKEALEAVANKNFPGHGAETAWMHCWAAHKYAQIPQATREEAWKEVIEWIICELEQGY